MSVPYCRPPRRHLSIVDHDGIGGASALSPGCRLLCKGVVMLVTTLAYAISSVAACRLGTAVGPD